MPADADQRERALGRTYSPPPPGRPRNIAALTIRPHLCGGSIHAGLWPRHVVFGYDHSVDPAREGDVHDVVELV